MFMFCPFNLDLEQNMFELRSATVDVNFPTSQLKATETVLAHCAARFAGENWDHLAMAKSWAWAGYVFHIFHHAMMSKFIMFSKISPQ